MTLIPIVGGAESNSFVTLVEAEARINSMSYSATEWNSKTDYEKEDCLILAAFAISRLPLRGRKVNRRTVVWDNMDGTSVGERKPGQALGFPRTVQYRRDVIPEEVKKCQIDIAATIIAPLYPPVGDSVASGGGGGGSGGADLADISKFRIGPMSVTLNAKKSSDSLDFKLSSNQLLSSSVVALRMQGYLAQIVGRRVDQYADYYRMAEVDRLTDTSTTTTTTTSSTTSTTTTTAP